MKNIKILIALFVFAVAARSQSAPAFGMTQGTVSQTQRYCQSTANVGSLYTQIGGQYQPFMCLQNGATSLGQGAFSWLPLQTTTTGGGGSIVIVSGKTFTVNNTLTLAGTDSTTMTFPTTSATIARTDAGQTFTGTQTFGAVIATGLTGLTSAPTPNAAGGVAVGSAALPFSGVYIGAAATNNALLTATTTAARTITFPDASITVPGTILTSCGSSASCASPSTQSSVMKAVVGTIAFSAATTATITAISPAFTGTQTYTCYASDPTHAAYAQSTQNQSGASFTITSGTSNSDTWNYMCVGY